MPSSSAVHTTDCILHPAARIDFEQHVRLLWEAGRKDEAETLWNSVVEVQHQPAPRAPILHGTDLPAMAAVPCTEPECERCANRTRDFASLGLESGAKTGCSSDMVCRHKRLGRIGRSRPVSWACCSFRCMEVAFLVRTLFRRHGSKLLPGRRWSLDVLLMKKCSCDGVTGNWDPRLGSIRWLSCEDLQERRRWWMFIVKLKEHF